MRDRSPRAAVADDQGVDLEYVLGFSREHSDRVVLPRHDAPNSLEGKPARQGLGVRQAQDLKTAVAHRRNKELRVFVEDHGPQVELPAPELDELFLDIVGRQDKVQLRERREHLARDVLRAAADGSDADAHATEVRSGP